MTTNAQLANRSDETRLLRSAARIARSETDPRWHAVADWLDNTARAAAESWNAVPPGSIKRDPDLYRDAFDGMYHYPLAVARALLAKEA